MYMRYPDIYICISMFIVGRRFPENPQIFLRHGDDQTLALAFSGKMIDQRLWQSLGTQNPWWLVGPSINTGKVWHVPC